MLARALIRSLQSPLRPAATASFRIASTHWTRNLASNNRRIPPKKPFEYTRSPDGSTPARPSSIGPQRTTGAEGSWGGKPATSTSNTTNSQYPKRQDGLSEKASLERNTTSESQRGAIGSQTARGGATQDPSISGSEEEFASSASPLDNTNQQDANADSAEFSEQALPDLRQGIPSTIDFELNNIRRTSAKAEGASLNLTEDPNQETGGGRRGRGELPASAYVSSSEKKRLRVANYLYASFAASCVLGYVWLGRNWDTEEEEQQHPSAPSGWAFGLMWARVKARMGGQLDYYKKPAFDKLLPDVDPSFERPYTLVLSLEDLLIHSEWSRDHGWRMAKRPGVDYFLRYLSQYYELVIFTSQPWAIGEAVIRKLDPYHIVTWPLYREATFYKNGEYVKDLSYLNRDLSKVILVDTVEGHAREQPDNAIILPKWKGDPQDKGLVALIPFLEYLPMMGTPDVRTAIKSFDGTSIPVEFARREAIARKKFEEQMNEERKKRPKSGLGFLSTALGVKPVQQMEGEVNPAEAFAQGKMLQDQARERGQRNYEALEKMIREEGEKWLKDEAANEELMKQEGMKQMKSGLTGFFGVPESGSKPDGTS